MVADQTTYDTKNQLLSEQATRAGGYTFSFAYDLAQNPTTFKGQSRAYNANNQLVGTGFAYDGNGNPVLYKGVNLAFDPENRMTAYGNILTAGYNGDGLRAWKQTATGRRYFLYDGEELVCELDAAGNVVAPVVFGANGLIAYSSFIYQFDPQGNAVHLMDNSRNVLANLAYDAWGQLMSGGYNPTPYGYKGQWGYYTDVETGILLLTHRYLDPATGRFLTRDPIGFEGDINLYAYVRNGVVMRADPRGTVAPGLIIGAACGLACGALLVCILSNWSSCWNKEDIQWEEPPCIGFRPRPGKPRDFWDRRRRTLICLEQECCRGWVGKLMCGSCFGCIWAAIGTALGGLPIRLPLPGQGVLVPTVASTMRAPSGQLIASPAWRW